MRPLSTKIWNEFQSAVVALSENSSLREVLGVVLSCIRDNYKYFAFEPFSTYGFDELSRVDEGLMPVEYSSFLPGDIAHFQKVILGYKAKEVEPIARFLRDTIEALITVEIDKKCPRCESDGLHIYIGRHNGLLACQCNVCGHSHYSDGSEVERGGLEFLSKEKLREHQII